MNLLLSFLLIISGSSKADDIDSLILSAESSLKTGSYLQALEVISLAEEKCKSDLEQTRLAQSYIVSSNLFMKVSKYSDAIQKLLLAQKIAVAKGDKKMIAEIYSNLAVLYFETADNREEYINKAEENIKNAYKIVKENNFPNNEIILNYGVIVYMYTAPDSALSFFLREKELINPNEHLDHVYINDYIGHIYKNRFDYKSALKYHHESLEFSKMDNNESMEAMNYANIAYSYFMLNRMDSAFVIADKSYQLAVATNNKYAMELSIDVLTDVFYKKNDIKNYRKYILIADSIQDIYYGNETTKEIAKMEFLHNIKIKDLRIDFLEKENQLKHDKMNIRIILLSIIAFVLVIIITILIKQTQYRKLIYKQKILLLKEDQEKAKYKNEKLKDEMKIRNRELITKTMLIADNKKLLENISKEIIKTMKAYKELDWKELNILLKGIKEHSKDFWDDFFLYFNGIHTTFLQKLNEHLSNLTSTEKKVCVLIKLNLSTKDISKITFNSPRTIEKHRSNIRKKLNLSLQDDLHQYLNEL